MRSLEIILNGIRRCRSQKPPDYAGAAWWIKKALSHPRASVELDLPELFMELSECYAQMGDFDKAIDAVRQAIDAGLAMVPDPRTEIADLLLQAGRTVEAHALYEQIKADTPDDVWLYNNAGLAYQCAGDHERALEWLTQGLELALKTGDPELLVDQLWDLRRESLQALGRDPDELQARAQVFLASHASAGHAGPTGASSAGLSGSEAFSNAAEGSEADLLEETRLWASPAPGPPKNGLPRMVVAWLPRKDFEAALQAWPSYKEEWERDGYEGYCRFVQRFLLKFACRGHKPVLAPVRIDAYNQWCALAGLEPESPQARSRYAAELAREGVTVPWPPGRNDPCWCGSGLKYKKCCGRIPSAIQDDIEDDGEQPHR